MRCCIVTLPGYVRRRCDESAARRILNRPQGGRACHRLGRHSLHDQRRPASPSSAGSESDIPAGLLLIERGHPATGLYVILEGSVVVDAAEGRTWRGGACSTPPRS